ncbi:MAG TPA: VanZ family protein [Clostridiales bacterium]|nr:VanZ family protein [Clostridiales bacterium]
MYWNVVFYIYIIFLSYFLFFSERYGRINCNEAYRYNLVFFSEINRFIKHRRILGIESFVVNIIGNILAFSPFGFILPLINKSVDKFYKVIILSTLFSLTVECLQLIFKVGIFDVDDILLNTIGGLLGYLAYKILRRKLV